MVDPDALRYLRIAQADLDEAQRMVKLSGFRDSSIGFRLQQACEKALKSIKSSVNCHDAAPALALSNRYLRKVCPNTIMRSTLCMRLGVSRLWPRAGMMRFRAKSTTLPPHNHPPHPTPRLRAIPLTPWDQVPMRMKHRLPRRLA
jgi:hypothetical protein